MIPRNRPITITTPRISSMNMAVPLECSDSFRNATSFRHEALLTNVKMTQLNTRAWIRQTKNAPVYA